MHHIPQAISMETLFDIITSSVLTVMTLGLLFFFYCLSKSSVSNTGKLIAICERLDKVKEDVNAINERIDDLNEEFNQHFLEQKNSTETKPIKANNWDSFRVAFQGPKKVGVDGRD